MYRYYKQAHKTHLMLIYENDKQIENWETINLAYLQKIQKRLKEKKEINEKIGEKPDRGIAVDAWCTNHLPGPGPCGYRGVCLETGKQLFLQNHLGPGTNNVAEFLAIIHGLMYVRKHKSHSVIWTDSEIAMAWIRLKQSNCKTNLTSNPKLVEKLWHAERWLFDQKNLVQVLKWETKHWGEIPADFGNK